MVRLLYRGSRALALLEFTQDFLHHRFISFIYLLPEYRGHNFGKQLEEYAMTLFKKHKCSHAELDVYSKNPKAMTFYEKNGWKIISEKDGFYRMRKGFI